RCARWPPAVACALSLFPQTPPPACHTLSLHDALPISVPDLLPAVERAQTLAAPEDVLVITGSFYLVGEAREWLRRRKPAAPARTDRKSTRLNSSHVKISYAVSCMKKNKNNSPNTHTTH